MTFPETCSPIFSKRSKFLADIAPYGKVKILSFHEDSFPSGDVKRVRSDNGGEFTSAEFSDLLVNNQIKHEKSAPYSPHQNGTAERSWRTLFEMGRSLLQDCLRTCGRMR